MVKYLFITILLIFSTLTFAEDRLELEITVIQGNKELPQILFVVPWKDSNTNKSEEQNLILHSLFGNYFTPVEPDEFENN